MAGVLQHRRGGILGLLTLCEQHTEAVEADLIRLGLRLRWLGTPDFDWCDLRAIIRHADPSSALVREMQPDAARWGVVEQLLAEAVDTLHWLQWAKTKDAQTKPPRNPPKPIPRPGVRDTDDDRIRFDVMEFDEALAWLGWDPPSVN